MHPRPWWEAADRPELRDVGTGDGGEGQAKARGRDAGQGRRAPASAAPRLRRGAGRQALGLGHQPGKITFADGSVRERDRVFQKFDGLVFLIDTGMSRARTATAGPSGRCCGSAGGT